MLNRHVSGNPVAAITARTSRIVWSRIAEQIDNLGYALIPELLEVAECAELIDLYPHRERFRSRVEMARMRFGVGEYKYFAAPLPPLVQALRETLYPGVATIANVWMEALRREERFPATLDEFLQRCHTAGQTRPTPLMLRYAAGGYNCLHQDLYGAIAFPLQFTIMLNRPDRDFSGGEFLLLEQRPRAQSKAEAVRLEQGTAILFPGHVRPVPGRRGSSRLNVRHGVSRIHAGVRFTLGIIFHDAS